MIRKGLIVGALILCLQGPALAQGVLDSVFGSGGLGLWGESNPAQQWNQPQFYGGSRIPEASGQESAGQAPQQYAQPGYAPPQQGYAPPPGGYDPYAQPGIYSDWHTQQPAAIGPPGQEANPPDQQQYGAPQQPAQQYPPQQQYASPQQQYAPPQQQYASPQQQYAPPQQPVDRQYVAPRQPAAAQTKRQPARQRQAAPAPVPVATQGYAPPPPLRPGQYAPDQQITDAENLPAGAVQVTTTTREGTQVQYYPPPGMPPEQGAGVTQSARQPRPRAAASRPPRQQTREQTLPAGADSEGVASIAMPKPVEIPQGQDPRSGWNAGANRSGSQVR
jgi:hypothetical protein